MRTAQDQSVKARFDNAGNCVICGEAGRCPNIHTPAEVVKAFEYIGYLAMYGGRKGHGFWLYKTTIEAAKQFNKLNGYSKIPGKSAMNDGKRSGNPYFWMMKDALQLLQTVIEQRPLPEVEPIHCEGSEPAHVPFTLDGGSMLTTVMEQAKLF